MKLVNLMPVNTYEPVAKINEDLEDMDVTIPAKVEKFLDRALEVIKGYNLPKRKEQLVMAKLVDALGMTPQDLQQAVQRLKKYKIAHK
jgi:hypothetical protein